VSCGIQCDAFSTRTSRAAGISRVSLSPSDRLPGIVNAPKAKRRRADIAVLSTSIVVWFVLRLLALRMIEIFPSSSEYGATMPASNSGRSLL
jgi:hypothetical protein